MKILENLNADQALMIARALAAVAPEHEECPENMLAGAIFNELKRSHNDEEDDKAIDAMMKMATCKRTRHWAMYDGEEKLPAYFTKNDYRLVINALIAVSPDEGSSKTNGTALALLDRAFLSETDEDRTAQLEMRKIAHDEYLKNV